MLATFAVQLQGTTPSDTASGYVFVVQRRIWRYNGEVGFVLAEKRVMDIRSVRNDKREI